MCIIQGMKRLDAGRQFSIVLHLRQVYEWCGLLRISSLWKILLMIPIILIEGIKGLISIAERRTAGTSGVGLYAILLLLISGCPFRLFGAKV